jgi:hypothetical protein
MKAENETIVALCPYQIIEEEETNKKLRIENQGYKIDKVY